MTYKDLLKAVVSVDFDASMSLPHKYDAKAVEEASTPAEALLAAFKWRETPQGFNYWNEIHEKLRKAEYELQKSA